MRTRGHTQTLVPTDVFSPPLTPACITDTTTGPPAALPGSPVGIPDGQLWAEGPWHGCIHWQGHWLLAPATHLSPGAQARPPHPALKGAHLRARDGSFGPSSPTPPESSLRPWLTMSQVDTLQGCWTARKPPLCGGGRCRRTGCPTQLTCRAQGPDPQSAACWGCEDSPLVSSSCPVVSVRTAHEPVTLSDSGSKRLSEGSLSCHQLARGSDGKGTAGS